MTATSMIRIAFLLALVIAGLTPAHASTASLSTSSKNSFEIGLDILCDDARSEAKRPSALAPSPALVP